MQKFASFSNIGGYFPKKPRHLNDNHTVNFSKSENPTLEVSTSYLRKCGILYFNQKRDHRNLFFRDDGMEPTVQDDWERIHSKKKIKALVLFLYFQKDWRATCFPPPTIFPFSLDSRSKFRDTHFVQHSSKYNNYAPGDDTTSHSP